MDFEWDPAKDAANLAKHGIDFAAAARIFEVPHIVNQSPFSQEDRWVAVGPVEGRLITVVYTRRGTTIRLISARRARTYERENYRALFPEIPAR
jgi:uncharacterized DUF497 family protein